MTTVAVTGSSGFLGRHLRLRCHLDKIAWRPVPRALLGDPVALAHVIDGVDAVIHAAAVNRGPDHVVLEQNVAAAEGLSKALNRCGHPPTVVFANSTSAGSPSVYGQAKSRAAGLLSDAASGQGVSFADVRLPNLFGEGGRPHYNSVVATFAWAAANGEPMRVEQDRDLRLVYVQDAAAHLLARAQGREGGRLDGDSISVSGLRNIMQRQAEEHFAGVIPDMDGLLQKRLFNMIRRELPAGSFPLNPTRHTDGRGVLFEGVHSRGEGLSFFSTTLPGHERGGHFHLRKFERFIVLSGTAEVRCRDLLKGGTMRRYQLDAEAGNVVDMQTYDVHTLRNTGTRELLCAFWISEALNPDDPDTYPEPENY